MGQLGLNRPSATRVSGLLLRFDLAVSIECKSADAPNKSLELVIAGYEIRLGVDFDDGTDRAARRDPYKALGRNPSRLAGGRRQTLLPQPVDGGLNVAIRVAKCPLAIHHAGACLFAQLPDKRRGYFHPLRQNPFKLRRLLPLPFRSAARCLERLQHRPRSGPPPRGDPLKAPLPGHRYQLPTQPARPAIHRAPRPTPDRSTVE